MRRFQGLVEVWHVAREGHEVAPRDLHRAVLRARPQTARHDKHVLHHALLVRIGMAGCARLEVERVDLEGAPALRECQRPAGPPRRLGGAHDRDVRSADHAERGALLLDEPGLARLRKIRRLTTDLGLNLAGVEVVLRLLDELAGLRAEVARSRLP